MWGKQQGLQKACREEGLQKACREEGLREEGLLAAKKACAKKACREEVLREEVLREEARSRLLAKIRRLHKRAAAKPRQSKANVKAAGAATLKTKQATEKEKDAEKKMKPAPCVGWCGQLGSGDCASAASFHEKCHVSSTTATG